MAFSTQPRRARPPRTQPSAGLLLLRAPLSAARAPPATVAARSVSALPTASGLSPLAWRALVRGTLPFQDTHRVREMLTTASLVSCGRDTRRHVQSVRRWYRVVDADADQHAGRGWHLQPWLYADERPAAAAHLQRRPDVERHSERLHPYAVPPQPPHAPSCSLLAHTLTARSFLLF